MPVTAPHASDRVTPTHGTKMSHTHRLRTAIMTALAGALVLSVTVDAEARRPLHEKEQRATLVSLLSAHEFQVNEGILRAIGPDTNRLLVHVSSDPNMRPSIRQNAVRSLVVFRSERTQRFLQTMLYDPDLSGTPHGTILRRQAMLTYGTAFRGKAVSALAHLARDADPQIREGAAQALGATGTEAARRILDAWLPHEPELFVRLAVDRALEAMRRIAR